MLNSFGVFLLNRSNSALGFLWCAVIAAWCGVGQYTPHLIGLALVCMGSSWAMLGYVHKHSERSSFKILKATPITYNHAVFLVCYAIPLFILCFPFDSDITRFLLCISIGAYLIANSSYLIVTSLAVLGLKFYTVVDPKGFTYKLVTKKSISELESINIVIIQPSKDFLLEVK